MKEKQNSNNQANIMGDGDTNELIKIKSFTLGDDYFTLVQGGSPEAGKDLKIVGTEMK